MVYNNSIKHEKKITTTLTGTLYWSNKFHYSSPTNCIIQVKQIELFKSNESHYSSQTNRINQVKQITFKSNKCHYTSQTNRIIQVKHRIIQVKQIAFK